MGKGQKEAVVEQVLLAIPEFILRSDNALTMLSLQQLNDIKANIFNGIINSTIDYGKDPNNRIEANSYARSMVMNHLKKAKELNGGNVLKQSTIVTQSNIVAHVPKLKNKLAPKGVSLDLLPEDLKEFAMSLVKIK